jgi:hypothetical protein
VHVLANGRTADVASCLLFLVTRCTFTGSGEEVCPVASGRLIAYLDVWRVQVEQIGLLYVADVQLQYSPDCVKCVLCWELQGSWSQV